MNLFSAKALTSTGEVKGTGWIPGRPDLRDYRETSKEVADMIKPMKKGKAVSSPPTKVDLRNFCSPIEDQRQLGSCTANAALGIVEYLEKRSFGNYLDGSRLFVYKVTRNLMGETGDSGAFLRTTMGALVHCGVPEEKYWPYTDAHPDFDVEPPAFIYSIADDYQAIKYFCHDPGANVNGQKVLESVKRYLAAGVPSMFGFYGFKSFEDSDVPGGIPYPCPKEKSDWGHAIVAIGYDDKKKITNTRCNESTTGALLIRNSWGTGWGDKGYGWMPYQYVIDRLADDFWSLLSMKYVDSGQFHW